MNHTHQQLPTSGEYLGVGMLLVAGIVMVVAYVYNSVHNRKFSLTEFVEETLLVNSELFYGSHNSVADVARGHKNELFTNPEFHRWTQFAVGAVPRNTYFDQK